MPKAARVLACESKLALTLPRRFRLTRRVGFSRILQQKAQSNHWFAVHSQPNAVGCMRLGMSVSKRIIPGAVRRNSIKRLIRDCFRHYAHQGAANDVVVRLRRPLTQQDRAAARSLLCEMFQLALAAK